MEKQTVMGAKEAVVAPVSLASLGPDHLYPSLGVIV